MTQIVCIPLFVAHIFLSYLSLYVCRCPFFVNLTNLFYVYYFIRNIYRNSITHNTIYLPTYRIEHYGVYYVSVNYRPKIFSPETNVSSRALKVQIVYVRHKNVYTNNSQNTHVTVNNNYIQSINSFIIMKCFLTMVISCKKKTIQYGLLICFP